MESMVFYNKKNECVVLYGEDFLHKDYRNFDVQKRSLNSSADLTEISSILEFGVAELVNIFDRNP